MGRILFIGSFLSASRGTKGVAESLAEQLSGEGIQLRLVSKFENKILRILDILLAVMFHKDTNVHIDVFSGSSFKIAEIASKLAVMRRKQIVLSLHGGKLAEFSDSQKNRIKNVFDRSKLIQTPSLFLQAYFRKEGYEVGYLPNGIDINKFPFKRTSIKPYSLLWVRGFASIYNPKLAVQILCELKKVYPQCTLTMVGPDKGLLQETVLLATSLGVRDELYITGPVVNEELYRYYQTHQVFLNTTSYESFGVAVVEAAACGIPIVSTNVGEIPFIWEHENNILLVNRYEAEEFVQSTIRLFTDRELSDKLSRNGRKKAELFNWENIKPSWVKILSE